MKYRTNKAVDMRKRKKRNTVIHNCGNYRSLLNDGVQRGGALMDLICQLGHKNHGVELMDLSDMNRMNHVNHVNHMMMTEEEGQEQEELPFPGERELLQSEEGEGEEQLRMEAHCHIDRHSNHLDNYCWNNHRPNNRSRRQKSLNPQVERLHIVHPHLPHHKSDDVSDHLEPYHEFDFPMLTSYATLISLNILSASSRLSVFLSGCHLSANLLYLDITFFLPFLRLL